MLGHCIDFDNSHVIDKGSFRIRNALESWHTSATKHADNNSKQLSNQYPIFLIVSLINTYFHIVPLFLSLTLFCIYFMFIFIAFLSIEGCKPTAESSILFIYISSQRSFLSILI